MRGLYVLRTLWATNGSQFPLLKSKNSRCHRFLHNDPMLPCLRADMAGVRLALVDQRGAVTGKGSRDEVASTTTGNTLCLKIRK